MGAHDLSDMYARPQPFGPVALRLWACISGKSHVATITYYLQLASNITCSWVTAYTYMQLLYLSIYNYMLYSSIMLAIGI